MSIQILYDVLLRDGFLPEYKFRHSTVYYVKALLAVKFPDRKFTLEQIEKLLDQEFNWSTIIPKWYQKKYFK